MRPVGQALVCIVNIVLIRTILHLTVPTAGMFIGAMVAAGLDLDRTERPPHNTPWGHSVLFVLVWNCIGIGVALALKPFIDPLDLGLGISLGLWGHLAMDLATGGTVYTIPNDWALSKVCLDVPSSDGIASLPDGSIAVSSPFDTYRGFEQGELVWPGWRRLLPTTIHRPTPSGP